MQDAVVAAENQTFWTDKGIDPKGIAARRSSPTPGATHRQGASTITQQYVKILYLTSEQSYKRKIKEAIVSLKIQSELSKEEVLEGYLNTIYFGRGAYGIQAAAAGLLRPRRPRTSTCVSAPCSPPCSTTPRSYDPANGKEAKEDLKGATPTSSTAWPTWRRSPPSRPRRPLKRLPKFPEIAAQSQYGGQRGHMLTLVKQELLALGIATEEEIDGGGLRITTTFDPRRDGRRRGGRRRAAARRRHARPGRQQGPAHRRRHRRDRAPATLLGFYGGQDYLDSQINWAVAGGMAGSTMKAATDVAAIRDGFSLNDTFEGNSPIDIAGTEFENQGDTDYGSAVSMITATENSINTAFVDMVDSMDDGPQKVIQAAEDLGIPGNDDGAVGHPATARSTSRTNVGVTLGTAQVSPINMANAYATLANGGDAPRGPRRARRSSTGAARRSTRRSTRSKRDRRRGHLRRRHLRPAAGRRRTGSGTEALALDRPAAGKTGTATNDDGEVSSSWFVGYHPADVDRRDVRPRQGREASTSRGPTVPTLAADQLRRQVRLLRRQLPRQDLDLDHGTGDGGHGRRGLPGARLRRR